MSPQITTVVDDHAQICPFGSSWSSQWRTSVAVNLRFVQPCSRHPSSACIRLSVRPASSPVGMEPHHHRRTLFLPGFRIIYIGAIIASDCVVLIFLALVTVHTQSGCHTEYSMTAVGLRACLLGFMSHRGRSLLDEFLVINFTFSLLLTGKYVLQ